MDVVSPTDDWQRGYAKLQYHATGLKQVLSTRVYIKTPCMTCGKLTQNWECERCDEIGTTQTDEMQQGDYED